MATSAFLLLPSPSLFNFSHRQGSHPPLLSLSLSLSLSPHSSLSPLGGGVVPTASSSKQHPSQRLPRGIVPGLDVEEGCFEDTEVEEKRLSAANAASETMGLMSHL